MSSYLFQKQGLFKGMPRYSLYFKDDPAADLEPRPALSVLEAMSSDVKLQRASLKNTGPQCLWNASSSQQHGTQTSNRLPLSVLSTTLEPRKGPAQRFLSEGRWWNFISYRMGSFIGKQENVIHHTVKEDDSKIHPEMFKNKWQSYEPQVQRGKPLHPKWCQGCGT